MSYNGWTNYETWAIKLWMDNHEGSYRHWLTRTKATVNAFDLGYRRDLADTRRLAEEIKAHHEAEARLEGFAGDLLGTALSRVDWREIAENLLEDVGQ